MRGRVQPWCEQRFSIAPNKAGINAASGEIRMRQNTVQHVQIMRNTDDIRMHEASAQPRNRLCPVWRMGDHFGDHGIVMDADAVTGKKAAINAQALFGKSEHLKRANGRREIPCWVFGV